MHVLWQDLRYGLRQLRKTPGFTTVAILTLTLGIGVNTAVFSVINGILLNPLPFQNPDQLVALHENKPNFTGGSISYPNFRDWQKENHTFSAIAIARRYAFNWTGAEQTEQINGEFISSDFFGILGVDPVLGRTFAAKEDEIGAPPAAMVSEGFWRRELGSDPNVLNRTLILDGKGYSIVGVVPARFHLVVPAFRDSPLYVPIGQWNNNVLTNRGAGLGIHGIARLKPGVTIGQARADMDSVSRSLAAAFPESDKGISADIVPLKSQMVGHVRPFLTLLLCAVVFVLLIACVNVINLLLARSAGRSREFAVRVAMGATQSRVLRQLVTESLLLSLIGGTLGLLFAHWLTNAALGILPFTLPRSEEIGVDARVLVFTFGLSVFAGILFGLTPALTASKPDIQEALKQGGRGASSFTHRTQNVFVVAEMAMALVLLIGAGLTIRSLIRLWKVDPGFNPKNVLSLGMSLPPAIMSQNPEALRASIRDLDARLAAIPGVRAETQTWGAVPLGPDDEQLFWMSDQPKPASENDMKWAIDYIVGPDYLKVMGISLKSGRFISVQDDQHSPQVVVVDDVFARTYFPNQDPIGKRIVLNNSERQVEIVGVVGHVKQWGLDTDDGEQLRAQIYLPCMQMPDSFITSGSATAMLLRTAPDIPTSTVVDSVRRVASTISGRPAVFGVQTMDSIISDTMAQRRFSMVVLATFAGLAVLLASVGIYGVISYLVARRTQEIGVRMALGAKPADVLRLVMTDGSKLAITGILVGVGGALVFTRLMANLLYGVSATDPVTFLVISVLLFGIAMAACYIPAVRATRVDPVTALRSD